MPASTETPSYVARISAARDWHEFEFNGSLESLDPKGPEIDQFLTRVYSDLHRGEIQLKLNTAWVSFHPTTDDERVKIKFNAVIKKIKGKKDITKIDELTIMREYQ